MGTFSTSDKPKFDLIAASKTKKYKIITAVFLIIGILLLGLSLLLRTTLTSAVTPNALSLSQLSNLDGTGPLNYICTISEDEIFALSTGTPRDRALANPITFNLDEGASAFLEIRDKSDSYAINQANYQGMFWLHIREDAPAFVTNIIGENEEPSGYLTITCGSKVLRIKFTYHKI